MSFFKSIKQCMKCKGFVEIWEHDESGEKSIHRLPDDYTGNSWNTKTCHPVCKCLRPQPQD